MITLSLSLFAGYRGVTAYATYADFVDQDMEYISGNISPFTVTYDITTSFDNSLLGSNADKNKVEVICNYWWTANGYPYESRQEPGTYYHSGTHTVDEDTWSFITTHKLYETYIYAYAFSLQTFPHYAVSMAQIRW